MGWVFDERLDSVDCFSVSARQQTQRRISLQPGISGTPDSKQPALDLRFLSGRGRLEKTIIIRIQGADASGCSLLLT